MPSNVVQTVPGQSGHNEEKALEYSHRTTHRKRGPSLFNYDGSENHETVKADQTRTQDAGDS